MPLYVYVCENCEHKEELIRKFSEADNLVVCQKCSNGAFGILNRMIREKMQSSTFQLKGQGWFKDGYSVKKR